MSGSPTKNDVMEIESCARDYAEGWYEGDAARMESCLHPELIKRTIVQRHDGGIRLNAPSTRDFMVDCTARGGGTTWDGEVAYEVEVLSVFRDIAMVRCMSPEYADFLHLARFGDEGWKIVNVLWQYREGALSGEQE